MSPESLDLSGRVALITGASRGIGRETALMLAFLPMTVLLAAIARNVTEPIKQFIDRQRERRKVARDTPDRRQR